VSNDANGLDTRAGEADDAGVSIPQLIQGVLDNHAHLFEDDDDADELSVALVNAMRAAMFGPVQPGKAACCATPGAGSEDEAEEAQEADDRELLDLYEACSTWTDGTACEVRVLQEEPALRLGPGAFLAMDTLEDGEVFPVLGYDLPDAGRVYYHRFPTGAEVWVTKSGAVVITHPDLILTPGGLDEGDSRAPDHDDEPDDDYDYDPGMEAEYEVAQSAYGERT